ncbi:hypothetical protein TNCV_837811 [Trichonephila clavipes]|nr:hypothetical protein TNCV_837811 [Trichonephila clavipes]
MMKMNRHQMNGLSLCSWNANGLLSKISEFRLFVEKYDPDILLIQETHLRPTLDININNYTCYRNDRITNGTARYLLKVQFLTLTPPPFIMSKLPP